MTGIIIIHYCCLSLTGNDFAYARSSRPRSEHHLRSVAIENLELKHECCPQNLLMGTARMKEGENKPRRYNIVAIK